MIHKKIRNLVRGILNRVYLFCFVQLCTNTNLLSASALARNVADTCLRLFSALSLYPDTEPTSKGGRQRKNSFSLAIEQDKTNSMRHH